MGKPIPCSSSNTVSKKPTNYLHRDHGVGTGASFCGLGKSLSATCQASLFGSSLSRYFVALRTFLMHRLFAGLFAIGRVVNGELVGTSTSISSDSARQHAGQAALCPSRAVLRIRTRRAGSASGSTASASALDRVVSQAVGYFRLCFLFAPPRTGGRWFWLKMPSLGGPVFGPLAGGRFPPNASRGITMGLLGGVESAPSSAVAASAVADGASVAAGAA